VASVAGPGVLGVGKGVAVRLGLVGKHACRPRIRPGGGVPAAEEKQ
jgi:hypothetical protein